MDVLIKAVVDAFEKDEDEQTKEFSLRLVYTYVVLCDKKLDSAESDKVIQALKQPQSGEELVQEEQQQLLEKLNTPIH